MHCNLCTAARGTETSSSAASLPTPLLLLRYSSEHNALISARSVKEWFLLCRQYRVFPEIRAPQAFTSGSERSWRGKMIVMALNNLHSLCAPNTGSPSHPSDSAAYWATDVIVASCKELCVWRVKHSRRSVNTFIIHFVLCWCPGLDKLCWVGVCCRAALIFPLNCCCPVPVSAKASVTSTHWPHSLHPSNSLCICLLHAYQYQYVGLLASIFETSPKL